VVGRWRGRLTTEDGKRRACCRKSGRVAAAGRRAAGQAERQRDGGYARIRRLTCEVRIDADRTVDAASCADPTARELTGDVDPLAARDIGPVSYVKDTMRSDARFQWNER
jgi:hypothetical protein